MGNKFKQALLVGAVMFGSIVGAGFASGKEVWFYFAQFGWVCFPLIALAGVLLFLLGFVFLEFGKKFGIESVQQMNSKLFGKFGFIGEIIFVFSNFILLSAMLAGAESLFDIVLSQDLYRFASVITAVIAVVISWLGFEKMVKVNLAVVPAMVLIIAVAFVYCVADSGGFIVPMANGTERIFSAVFFSILYVCSNLFFAGFIFARLGVQHSKGVNLGGSAIAAGFMILCLVGMVISIYLNPYSSMSDMPLVYIASNASYVFGIFTLVVVWIGITTTAVSLVYTIAIWLEKYISNFKLCSILVAIICLIISGLGFGAIVSYCYPVLGVIGVLFILRLLWVTLKNKEKPPKITLKMLKNYKKS